MLTNLRKWTAVLLLVAAAGLFGFLTYMVNWGIQKGPPPSANFFFVPGLAAALLAVFGVIREHAWARWLALGIGVSGTCLSGSIFAALAASPARADFFVLLFAAGPLLLTLTLAGSAMAKRLGSRSNPFRERGRRAGLLGLSLVLSMAAVPTLWAWACLAGTGHGPSRSVAFGATIFLVLGATLIMMQRTAGLLALWLGGSLAFSLAVTVATGGIRDAATGLMGIQWLLAVAGGLTAMVATARPIGRVLAGKAPHA